MRLIRIWGKIESCSLWSNRKADYVGFFIQEEDGAIRGYVREKYDTQYDPVRYIKGFYDEDKKQLVFMKLCNVVTLRPLAYVFQDTSKEGVWSVWNWTRGFFPDGNYRGLATVRLEEVTNEKEKSRLTKEVDDTFWSRVQRGTRLNRQLLDEAEGMKGFVDPSSPFYLNQQ